MKVSVKTYPSNKTTEWLKNIQVDGNGKFDRLKLNDETYWEVRDYIERNAGNYHLTDIGLFIKKQIT